MIFITLIICISVTGLWLSGLTAMSLIGNALLELYKSKLILSALMISASQMAITDISEIPYYQGRPESGAAMIHPQFIYTRLSEQLTTHSIYAFQNDTHLFICIWESHRDEIRFQGFELP